MNFLTLKDNRQVALSEVVMHWPAGEHYVVQLRDGVTHRTSIDAWLRAMRQAVVAVIPAAPGTAFLTRVLDENNVESWDRDSVVGWALNADGQVNPVGPDGIDDGERPVLMPSGRVVLCGVNEWENLEAYLEAKRHEERL